MSLADVKHQDHAHDVMQRALARERLPHACIFHGPDGVGKEMFAIGLAEFLLCGGRDVDTGRKPKKSAPCDFGLLTACGKCPDCCGVRARIHPDLHLIHRRIAGEHPDPVVKKRKSLDLGVDLIRHFVIDPIGLMPIRGRAKIFIIRDADWITAQAQSALLKTLEEPPGTTYLFLLAASTERFLATTLSRCQIVRFDPLPSRFVEEKLAELRPELSSEQRRWYARANEGSLGAALRDKEFDLYAASQRLCTLLPGFRAPDSAKRGPAAVPTPTEIAKAWMAEAKILGAIHDKLEKDLSETDAVRRGTAMLLRLAATWYADLLRTISGRSDLVVNQAHAGVLAAASRVWTCEWAARAVQRLAVSERQLDQNVNAHLSIDVLVNELSDFARRAAA